MDFKLQFAIQPPPRPISIKDKILIEGSCFAEHMGARLLAHKFNVVTNPNGIVFNPLSMASSLHRLCSGTSYTRDDIFEHKGIWHSWQHHGAFSSTSAEEVLQKMNESFDVAVKQLQKAEHVILTFGSAFVYEHKGQVVANCHKVPQAQFQKRLAGVKEILAAYEKVLGEPAMSGRQVILTVSPVRYVRDGLVENNHSKAVLIRAVHDLVEQHGNCYYFPAYEIVLDELRDYRFFEEDMVHPNKMAIDYVWERFCDVMMDAGTKDVMERLDDILSAKKHIPIHAGTDAHRQFLKRYAEKSRRLQQDYSFINLLEEIQYFAKGS